MAGLIPWSNRGEVDRFRGNIDRLFDDFFARSPFGGSFDKGDWVPAVDLSENDKEIIIHAEIPGIEVKDIDISLNGRVLNIKGERKQEKEEKEKDYHCIERRYGSFSRSFELPADVDFNNVEARYKDGVLKLNLPKTKEQSIKKIEIKTS
ncbi:MAG: Hsp20/alpha crystallin family protein [Deltaproteobacteria bacterium]|nr:Hsp20/alpha crystallin family protein [Deltaproteobacteria bacterium]